jgi:hypothetical protein
MVPMREMARIRRPHRIRTAIVLLIFATVFAGLSVGSYTQESATWDEPIFLTAGYTALKLHDYRIEINNPPFLQMWAALPLLVTSGIRMDTNGMDAVQWDGWNFSHRFLYQQNDADRLLYRARFMIVLLGILLGILLFCWAQELFGITPAVLVLALYSFEPNVLAHSSLVTTDLGVTCFFFGTSYFLWRTTRKFSLGNLAGLATFFALAQISKYSAVLLGPTVFVLLVVHACRNRPWCWHIGHRQELSSPIFKLGMALATALILAAASYVAVWAVFGFRYAPAWSGSAPALLQSEWWVVARLPRLAAAMNWIDARHLLPNSCAQGFLRAQAQSQMRWAFLAGRQSTRGWWYYFPLAFLIKTPITVILLFLAGVILCVVRRSGLLQNELFVLVPMAIYMGVSMTSHLNIGLRHILPTYPFVLLLAGKVAVEFRGRQQALLCAALAGLAACELSTVRLHHLCFFNQFVGGPGDGYRYLADSNLDWGQDLKRLKRWMDQHGVRHINLSYNGTADPAYYGIDCTYLEGSPFFARIETHPRLPGYVVVSTSNLDGIYASNFGKSSCIYKPLLEKTPVAVIGYSMHVYWVDRDWW